ncbi:MAG: ComF family protein [Bacteroidia bacterium]
MRKILQSLGQLILPNLCVCCDGYLSHQEIIICDLCSYSLPRYESFDDKESPLAKKFWGRIELQNVAGLLNFKGGDNVRKILHQIKYKGNMKLGIEAGKMLGRRLSTSDKFSDIDIVIAVPLHAKRELSRGYNQSELLVQGIRDVWNKESSKSAIERIKYNSTQTKKNRYERYINAKEIFKVTEPELLEGKHILLIDDVITTGATIEACGAALLDVKGVKLSVATLAVAY